MARWRDVEYYPLLKTLHVVCAAISGAGFLLRSAWMWTGHPWHGRRLTRTLPHLVDSLLLASAIAMLWMASLSPLSQPWLAAKIVALVGYIAAGTLALRGSSRRGRGRAVMAAVMLFAYIVGVALTRSPAPGVT